MDCASPPLSPPSPGLARGWREGGGLLDLDCASLPLSPPTPGLARGWWEGGGLLDWTAPLCHPHRRPRAWPVGGGRGVDYWTWTTILRHPHRRPRGSFSTNTAPSWPLRLAGASFPTNGLPRRLDDGHRLLLRSAGPCGWQAPPSRQTSSTSRRRTSTASHHALRGRPSCPLRSENGKVRKKQAHNGGLSRLLPLRPAGPRGWQARPALCWPPPGTWPRLGVGGR